MVRGSCPVLSPFLGCLSGSSELDLGSVELLRTYEVRFSDSESTLHPGLCLGWAHWVFLAMSFSGSLSRSGGRVSFAFVTGFVAKTRGPSLAPRFAGFTVPAQPTRDNSNGRLLYPVRAVRCYLVRLCCVSSVMRVVPFCRRV